MRREAPVHALAFVEHRDELAAAVVRVARQESQPGERGDLRRLHKAPGRVTLARNAHQRVVEARELNESFLVNNKVSVLKVDFSTWMLKRSKSAFCRSSTV